MIPAIESGGHHPHGRRPVHTRSRTRRQRAEGSWHMLQYQSRPAKWSRGIQYHMVHSPSGTPRCTERWCQSVPMRHSGAEVWPQLWIESPVRLRSIRTNRRCCRTVGLEPSTLRRWVNSNQHPGPLACGNLHQCMRKHPPDADRQRPHKIHDFDREHKCRQSGNTPHHNLLVHIRCHTRPRNHQLSHTLQW